MTTIEIFKSAKIVSIDRIHKTVTATGIDSVTRSYRRRTFEFVTDSVLDKAERFLVDKTPLVIDVDSSTKNIGLRILADKRDGTDSSRLLQTSS
jgi:hypothetical protein